MSLRSIAKSGVHLARRASVRLLSVPRQSRWCRDHFRIPSNQIADPLRPDTLPAGMRVTRLDDGEWFTRGLPEAPLDPGALPFFRQRIREEITPSYAVEIEGGRVWGHPFGAVLTPDGRLVVALARDPWGPALHRVWTRWQLPPIKPLRGKVLNLVTPEASDNFHHWLVDLLPRIGVAKAAGHAPASFDHVIVNHRARRYQIDTLRHLGIPPEKLISVSPGLHVQADLLVSPSLQKHNQCMPPASLRFLRESFLEQEKQPAALKRRRVFLSRRDAGFRRLLNETELTPFLKDEGFEIVQPSELSVRGQAALFAEAEVVAGPGGAAFANLVFATPGARALEITPPEWLVVYHWMISARLGLQHILLLGEGEAPPDKLDIQGRTRDFTLSRHKLAEALSGAAVRVQALGA